MNEGPKPDQLQSIQIDTVRGTTNPSGMSALSAFQPFDATVNQPIAIIEDGCNNLKTQAGGGASKGVKIKPDIDAVENIGNVDVEMDLIKK